MLSVAGTEELQLREAASKLCSWSLTVQTQQGLQSSPSAESTVTQRHYSGTRPSRADTRTSVTRSNQHFVFTVWITAGRSLRKLQGHGNYVSKQQYAQCMVAVCLQGFKHRLYSFLMTQTKSLTNLT